MGQRQGLVPLTVGLLKSSTRGPKYRVLTKVLYQIGIRKYNLPWFKPHIVWSLFAYEYLADRQILVMMNKCVDMFQILSGGYSNCCGYAIPVFSGDVKL